MSQQWTNGRVVELKHWSGRLYSLCVSAEIEPFEAGQFLKIGLPINGEIVGRPYSLVNAPNEQPLEFYFITVDNGPLTSQLVTLQSGDEIQVAPRAVGFLTLSEVPPAKHLWLMATGTGVGPFLSILKTMEPWRRFEKIVLAQAVRTTAELTYQETVKSIAAQHPEQFIFAPFVSREGTDFALRARIPQAIANGMLEERVGLSLNVGDSQFMLCGNPEMVRDTTDTLIAHGFKKHRRRDPGHIIVEAYW
jgi:ferredoxin/flavodoxin---NADP+ reductase